MRSLVPMLSLAVALSGCGVAPDSDEVQAVTVSFYDALRDDRGRDACELLGEATVQALESQESRPCREAITALGHDGGDIANVHVFVTSAKVDLSTGESVFLNREPGGWKLSALACRVEDGKPRDRPLDCQVEA